MKARLTGAEVDRTRQRATWSAARRWRRLAGRRAWRRHVGGTGRRRCGGVGRLGGPGAALRGAARRAGCARGAVRRAGAARRGAAGAARWGELRREYGAHERRHERRREKKQNGEEGTDLFLNT
jgi:hypothetical protein